MFSTLASNAPRRLGKPDANNIPDDFLKLWQDAVKTNSKACLFTLISSINKLWIKSESGVELWYISNRSASHFTPQATKSALFEKWLTAGKDWSLLLAYFFLVGGEYHDFLSPLRLRVESTRTHTDREVSIKKMGTSSWESAWIMYPKIIKS